MANRLKMGLAESIGQLHEQGWSQRRIARELDVNRETVARHLGAGRVSKPAKAPPGSGEALEVSKPAKAPPGSAVSAETNSGEALTGSATVPAAGTASGRGGRASDCEPHRQWIVARLEQGLSAQRIFQDLVEELAFAGSYYSVRRFIGRLEERTPWPFRRLECGPGEEAQVDFGSGIPIVGADGKRRRTHVFRIVLSHSRKGYSEAVFRQTTDDFLACLENAFWHFGGVPQRLILDNLRAAVRHPDWFDPELTPKVAAFARYYGVVLLPTKPRTPRHKGKIEKGVGYVKSNALKGRRFTSLVEENTCLQRWEATVADTRVHGTTRQHVGKTFLEVERPALQPLPRERFPSFTEAQRCVHCDGHIEIQRSYYSVPAEYTGHQVWARWDSRLVRIFSERMEEIAVHVRQEPGRFSTQRQHIVSEKINSVERGAEWLLEKVRRLGEACSLWAEAMLEERGVAGLRVLQGLLALTKKHSCCELHRACEIAHSYGAYRLRTLRALLQRQETHRQAEFEFMEEDAIIRPLAEYSRFVRQAFAEALNRKEAEQ